MQVRRHGPARFPTRAQTTRTLRRPRKARPHVPHRPVDQATLDTDGRALLDELGVDGFGEVLVRSPHLARGFLRLDDALVHGAFRPRVQEQISLAVAEANGCTYCLSSHTQTASALRVAPEEIELNRTGHATDEKVDAALHFVRAVVDTRGGVSDEELRAVRSAGHSDEEILELVGHVVLNTLTNYLNKVIDTAPDAPKVIARPELAAPARATDAAGTP